MNFRIYNHVLEFPMVNRRFAPGRIDTRRTRRASGRVFRGWFADCQAASGRSAARDTRRNRRHPGEIITCWPRGAFGACGRYSGFSRG